MRTITVQVLASDMVKQGVEAVLGRAQRVRLTEKIVDVLVLEGEGWEERLNEFLAGGGKYGGLVLMAGDNDQSDLQKGSERGIRVYVSREETFDLEQAVRQAAGRKDFCSKRLLGPIMEAMSCSIEGVSVVITAEGRIPLTREEMEVALLAARGMSNQRMAAALDVGESTIKRRLGRVLKALNVERKSDLGEKILGTGGPEDD